MTGRNTRGEPSGCSGSKGTPPSGPEGAPLSSPGPKGSCSVLPVKAHPEGPVRPGSGGPCGGQHCPCRHGAGGLVGADQCTAHRSTQTLPPCRGGSGRASWEMRARQGPKGQTSLTRRVQSAGSAHAAFGKTVLRCGCHTKPQGTTRGTREPPTPRVLRLLVHRGPLHPPAEAPGPLPRRAFKCVT